MLATWANKDYTQALQGWESCGIIATACYFQPEEARLSRTAFECTHTVSHVMCEHFAAKLLMVTDLVLVTVLWQHVAGSRQCPSYVHVARLNIIISVTGISYQLHCGDLPYTAFRLHQLLLSG